jgi:DNA invertase Pin-like site-specific DNA recombinase
MRKPKKQQPPSREPVAHPYARVSDPDQSLGTGIKRQTEEEETLKRIAEFCRIHGFKCSKHFRVDDGVSAWKGLNASPEHELGQFLQDANRGLILPGDCLLLENYDRMSRQNPWAAIGLVNDLRELRIHVGRLDNMRLLRYDSTDYGDFFDAAVEFVRANSESNMKSHRNLGGWRIRREAARSKGETATRRLPAWVEERDGVRLAIPDRAAVIRRIFTLSAAGYGVYSIRRLLHQEGVPAFGEPRVREGRKRPAFSGRWTISYIQAILADRRVLGEWQPKDSEGNPEGDPIPGYYPQVVTPDEWEASRAGARDRRTARGRWSEAVNVFKGLLKDARNGSSYIVTRLCGRNVRYFALRSEAPLQGGGSINSIKLEPFERAVFSSLREINPAELLDRDGPDETLTLSRSLERVRAELAEANAFMDENGFSPSIGKRIKTLEDRERSLAADMAAARELAAHPLSEAWGQAQTLFDALASAPDPKEARMRLRTALRRIVAGLWVLVIPQGRVRLCAVQIWFAGGNKHREYLIYHRSLVVSHGRHFEEVCRWSSMLTVVKGPELDLRRPDHAAALEEKLKAVDMAAMVKKGWGKHPSRTKGV